MEENDVKSVTNESPLPAPPPPLPQPPPSKSEGAQFDILDCVEEPFDDIADYLSSEESRDVAFSEGSSCPTDDGGSVSDNAADESPPSSRLEMETVFEGAENVPSDCEECDVAERPASANSPLPAGWQEIYHESGATIFVHPETNVCSLSRPYFLGSSSTKSHILPESAIPCLSYRKAGADDANATAVDERTSEEATPAKQDEIMEYCKRLFKLKKIKYLKFRSWDVRRSYLRTLRNERNRRKCPFSNSKLITFPIVTKDDEGNVVSTKKCIINPRGKSYVAILHEYLQQSLKAQPVYTFSEVENARTPYASSVLVNGNEYGSGVGMSKKEAKLEAAKAALLVLLPKMKKYILNVKEKSGGKKDDSDADVEQNVASVFNDIEITDPRVTQLSMETTEPKPYQLLLKYLHRKADQREVKFDFQVESKECTMSVGEHTVTIQCTNKRDGKQQAAQALLQELHPYINNWGSLLRLYSNDATDQYQLGNRLLNVDKEPEETKRVPNTTLLENLRERMLRLQEESR